MHGGMGTVTIKWVGGHVSGGPSSFLVMDHDTGKYWRIADLAKAERVAERMANGRKVVYL